MTNYKLNRRWFLAGSSLIGLSAAFGGAKLIVGSAEAAETWKPDRTIQVVIQFGAGGGTDTVTRTLLAAMEPILGQKINATNMTGALGAIASNYVQQQPADGHTWVGAGGFSDYPRIMGIGTSISWMDWQYYQSATSLASWAVHPDSPIKTFGELIAYAKANPGKLLVSTDGEGGLWHEAISIIALKAGFTFTNVPFDGGAPATLAAVQKEVDVAGSGLHEQIQFIRAGKLRHLATFTADPVRIDDKLVLEPVTKYVPSAAANTPFGGMYALALRRDTPVNILQAIAGAMKQAIASPKFQKLLSDRFIKETPVFGAELDKKMARLETERAVLFQTLGLAKKTPQELGLPAPKDFESWWPPAGYKPIL